MGNIAVLSEDLVNKIAAGEVIENPASVIKELVENSIDAGAESIFVEIKGGGELLIKVADDGKGMDKADALLCLKRHATSKIKTLEDLQNIHTLGFRGEALAAIAAISRVTLESKQENNEGVSVEIEGGEVKEVKANGRARGTTIEVKSLFYNVPARKKFQKSASANSAEISKMMQHLSLAHPTIAIKLVSQEKELLVLGKNTGENAFKRRIGELFGRDLAEDLQPIEIKREHFKVSGFLAPPLDARKNRSGNFLFINERSVFSLGVGQAVKEGYGTRLQEGFFPTFFLHLTIDPTFVDVNVHPQKREVRLRDEYLLKEELKNAVSKAFEKNSAPILSFSPTFSSSPAPIYDAHFRNEELFSLEEASSTMPTFLPLRPITVLQNYLLVIEGEDLLIVDLGAAASRLLFDTFKGDKAGLQSLALPIQLDFALDEMGLIMEKLVDLKKYGFELRPLGPRTIAVEAIFPHLAKGEMKEMILDIIHDLSIDQERKVAQNICRCMKRRKNYSLNEALSIFDSVKRSSDSKNDPLGNPIQAKITAEDFAKLMRR